MTSPGAPPRIDGMRCLRHLGSGGFADVFLYRDEVLGRDAAVKVLRDAAPGTPLAGMLIAEANAMARLEHANIVTVYFAKLAADRRPYIVMRFYPNGSLADLLKQRQLTVADVLRFGIQIAAAVETAHGAGLLHRDIKPANVLLSASKDAVLCDFGIASRIAEAESEDRGFSVPWSSPEAIFAGPVSVTSDVYSLGALMWHLLAGRSPFAVPGGDNSTRALMQRIRDNLPPPTGRPDVPASLERLLAACLAKDPARRPPAAFDVVAELKAIQGELGLPPTGAELSEPQDLGLPPAPGYDGTRDRALRQVSPQAPATQLKTAETIAPAPAPAPTPRPGRARRWLIVSLASLTLAVAGGVGLALNGNRAPAVPTPSATESEPTPDAGNGDQPPGPVSVTGRRETAGARFAWTYSGRLNSDFYRWQATPGGAGTVEDPTLLIPAKPGVQVCLQVKVVRESGNNASPDWSAKVCVK